MELNCLTKNYKYHWLTFGTLTIVLTIKLLLFNAICFSFASFDAKALLYQIIISICVASFVFLIKNKWWMVALCLVLDVWMLANILYFRANELFIDWNAIQMIDQLSNYTQSLGAYFDWWILVEFIITILFALFLYFFKIENERKVWLWLIIFCGSLLLNEILVVPQWYNNYYKKQNDLSFKAMDKEYRENWFGKGGVKLFEPFHGIRFYAYGFYDSSYPEHYIQKHSILHYGLSLFAFQAFTSAQSNDLELPVDEQLHLLFVGDKTKIPAKENLIIILVESFESWPLNNNYSDAIAPNLSEFLKSEHIAYFSKIKSQVRHGVSGDGQMIVNSGLLPVKWGAACNKYGDNIWPNIASNFDYSVLVDPATGIWNQREMSKNYGYKSEVYSEAGYPDDKTTFTHFIAALDTIHSPFCSLIITADMHSPFNNYPGKQLTLPDELPDIVKDYLECYHVTDECIGLFYDKFKNDSTLQNSTVIITGDHTVFKTMMLQEFNEVLTKNGFNIENGKNYTPLIIYSPKIAGNQVYDKECYQMDVFPTIMNLMGLGDYYWKGLGVNLFDEQSVNNRHIDEAEAYTISNSLIVNDYFKSYIDSIR